MLKRLAQFNLDDLRFLAALLVLLTGYAAYWVVSRSLKSMAAAGHVSPNMAGRLRGLLRLLSVVLIVPFTLQQAGAFDNAWTVLSASITGAAIGLFAQRTAAMLVPNNQFFQRTIRRFDNSNLGDSFFG